MRLLSILSILSCVCAFVPAQLPGVSAPLGFFDPLKLSKDKSPIEFKKLQESEIKHSRVAMLAAVGLIVQDVFHPLFKDELIGKSIYHYQIVSERYPWVPAFLISFIGLIELINIQKGWEMVSLTDGIADLRADYIPGDLGFDPFGLSSSGSDEFRVMRTKELNNGRLAMIACVLIVLKQYIETYTYVAPYNTPA